MAGNKTNSFSDVRLDLIREEIEAAVERAITRERSAVASRFRERRRKRKESEALLKR